MLLSGLTMKMQKKLLRAAKMIAFIRFYSPNIDLRKNNYQFFLPGSLLASNQNSRPFELFKTGEQGPGKKLLAGFQLATDLDFLAGAGVLLSFENHLSKTLYTVVPLSVNYRPSK